MDRLHQSKVNVMRDKQAKQMEQLLCRQEEELEKLARKQDEDLFLNRMQPNLCLIYGIGFWNQTLLIVLLPTNNSRSWVSHMYTTSACVVDARTRWHTKIHRAARVWMEVRR